MPREDWATWKSNYFITIIQLLLHCGRRQCGLHADAADLHVTLREGRGADRQERHDSQGHQGASGKQPGSGGTAASHSGNVDLAFTKEALTEIRDMLLANKVPAAGHAGTIAPCEVTVPA